MFGRNALKIVLTGHLVKIFRILRKKNVMSLNVGLFQYLRFYMNHVPTNSANVMQRMCKC